jgi:hypothetical protein
VVIHLHYYSTYKYFKMNHTHVLKKIIFQKQSLQSKFELEKLHELNRNMNMTEKVN